MFGLDGAVGVLNWYWLLFIAGLRGVRSVIADDLAGTAADAGAGRCRRRPGCRPCRTSSLRPSGRRSRRSSPGCAPMITVDHLVADTLVAGLVIPACASPRIGGMSLRSCAEAPPVTRPTIATANRNCPRRFIDTPPISAAAQRAASWRASIAPCEPYISPFQSSGSAVVDRKTSRCHLPPPQGSMTSVATTSTRISANVRPSGSPSRW